MTDLGHSRRRPPPVKLNELLFLGHFLSWSADEPFSPDNAKRTPYRFILRQRGSDRSLIS